MDLALPFFLFLWALGAAKGSPRDLSRRPPGTPKKPTPAPAVAPPVKPTQPTVTTKTAPYLATSAPAPWPQVVPSGLPPFPGSGWVPDEPPGPGVAARAAQLLGTLWAHGVGTFKTEQTGGRWITYRATTMGTKKGVVAYRLAPAVQVAPPPAPAPSTAVPVSRSVPAPAPAPAPATAPATALPTLRRGSQGAEVQMLQTRLGIPADGKFGPQTETAVKNYQRANGLQVDGVVGRQTWSSLYGGRA